MEYGRTGRIAVLFLGFVFCACILIGRLAVLASGQELTEASTMQSTRTLTVAKSRGMIYDHTLTPLVGTESFYRASVMPTESAVQTMTKILPEQSTMILELARQRSPFTLDVPERHIYARDVHVFEVFSRYTDPAAAPHLVGYTDSAGDRGLSGIERAYDEYLSEIASAIKVTYQADVIGNPVEGTYPVIEEEGYPVREGIVLTLDAKLQEICRKAALAQYPQPENARIERVPMKKGGVLVMNPDNGNILACVSFPEFSQNDPAASLDAQDSPFLNRCLSAYNVGSPFKLVMAACALENGISRYHTYTCKGYEDISGQIFYCNNRNGHGEIDMKTAVAESCNTYFIHLMEILGPDAVMLTARSMGFGMSDQLAEGIVGAAGSLPELELLHLLPAEAANFSFGQGKLLATPLQLAKMIAVIANGGNSVTPRLVEGFTDPEGTTIVSHEPVYASNPVLLSGTAAVLREFMTEVVENGSGIYAKPESGFAGGKTGSAQTGLYRDEEEIVHAWFAGFYPDVSPKYVIVVFVEEGASGAHAAAPVFKDIVDALNRRE